MAWRSLQTESSDGARLPIFGGFLIPAVGMRQRHNQPGEKVLKTGALPCGGADRVVY